MCVCACMCLCVYSCAIVYMGSNPILIHVLLNKTVKEFSFSPFSFFFFLFHLFWNLSKNCQNFYWFRTLSIKRLTAFKGYVCLLYYSNKWCVSAVVIGIKFPESTYVLNSPIWPVHYA